MSKKHKKKRNKPLRPPLTLLDKSIYILCLILSVSSGFALIIGLAFLKKQIAFADTDAVAFTTNASTALALPFVLYFTISAAIFFIVCLEDKKPLFGNKNIHYGIPPYAPDCIPLFGKKNCNVYIKPSHKRNTRKLFCLWGSALLAFACLLPFCLFGRDVLYQDNRIETFNAVNLTTDTYTAQDYLHLTVRAYRTRSGRHGVSHWDEFSVTIETKDGKEYTFSCYDFDGTADERLDYMLEIKSLFSREAITFQNADKLETVADRQNMTESQRAKLYELFFNPS